MRSIVIASLVLTIAGTAAAQPAATPPPPAPPSSVSPTAPAAPPPAAAEEPPYQSTALLLSFTGSLAAWSTLLIAANIDHGGNPAVPVGALMTLLAPSFGHWYAGDGFSRGLRNRLIGAGIVVTISIPFLSCSEDCDPGPLIKGALYGGIALYLIGTLDDIVTAPDAARTASQRRRSVAVTPMIHRGGSGLVVTAQF